MRPVSFVTPLRAERISEVSSSRSIREEEKPKRVRDVKDSEKQEKKRHRVFRIKKAPMTPQQQRQFAKQLNSYQLRAMRDWYSFSDSLDIESLNDAQKWVLHAVNQSQHLYPKTLRREIRAYLNGVSLDQFASLEEAPDGATIQQLLAYEDYLEGILAILVLCRRYDEREKKRKLRQNAEENCSSENKE
ncbi:TPA: hypothetical protein ACMDT4_003852 [Vibrio parahaemolyticus]|uniref:ATP-dependent exonuclease n=1 Tax=Vibrio parahaemolyticus TaxID=670 RepID=B9A7Z6_VIBPH|nr:hypothetical protein [Vibrio parahaemolyticus]